MSKIDLVYRDLRALIVSGRLAPGAAIDKAAVADRLGASRQPIAAAIDRLAFEGLVEVLPQHGSFVSRLDGAAISDWFVLRTALEAEFAMRFAAALDTAPLAELERNLRYQQAAADAEDHAGFYALDIEFHSIINTFTPSPEGRAILDRAQANLGRVRQILLPEPGRMQITLDQHKALVTAIASGSAQAAADAARAHLRSVEQHFRDMLSRRPDLTAQHRSTDQA